MYADYDYYCNVYLGNSISPEDFPRLSERASDYVRGATRGLSDKVGDHDHGCMDAVQKVTCAIAEILQDEANMNARGFSGEAVVSSETVGNWSRSYRDPSVSSSTVEYINQRKQEAIRTYLEALPCFKELFGVQSFSCLHKSGRRRWW